MFNRFGWVETLLLPGSDYQFSAADSQLCYLLVTHNENITFYNGGSLKHQYTNVDTSHDTN
jgi:hypothetical protein